MNWIMWLKFPASINNKLISSWNFTPTKYIKQRTNRKNTKIEYIYRHTGQLYPLSLGNVTEKEKMKQKGKQSTRK